MAIGAGFFQSLEMPQAFGRPKLARTLRGKNPTVLVDFDLEFFPEAVSPPFPLFDVHFCFDFPQRTTPTGFRVLHSSPG